MPVLVIVVLIAALIYRLSSCTPGGSSTASEASASLSPSSSTSPSAAVSPTAPYSGAEIKKIYEGLGLSVVEIRDAGDYTMVHYYSPSGVPGEIISRFDWFDRRTGARALVYGGAYTEKFEIKADKSFCVLTTGLSHIDGRRSFPVIFTAGYTEIDGAVKFYSSEAQYYAPLDQSYTLGTERRESLTDINFNSGFVSLGFGEQAGYESEFYAASMSIPKMDIRNENGFTTITLYKTILSKGAEVLNIKENPYCSLVSMTTDGIDTVITLKLNDSVSRYNVSAEFSPKTGLPYAVIEYTNVACDYPAGW